MALKDDIHILKATSIFKGVDSDALRLLAFGSDHATLPQNRIIVDDGNILDFSLVLISGSFVSFDPVSGREDLFEEQGSMIGEQVLVTKRFYSPYRIQTIERSEFIRIRRELFWRVVKEHPEAAIKIKDYLTHRLTSYTSALKNQTWVR